VTALLEDRHGTIWVGSHDAVVTYSDEESLAPLPKHQFSLSGATCFAEEPHRPGIWAGNDAGLFRIEGDQVLEQRDNDGRSIREVASIYAHPGGTLWIGTRTGLLRLRGGSVTRITGSDSLEAPRVTAVLPDDLGYLWIGTQMGVARASLAELESYSAGSEGAPFLQLFTTGDGLAYINCSDGSQPTATRDRQGRLWFATLGGVTMVDPQRLPLNTNPPPVVIEQVRIEDPSKNQRNLLLSDTQPLVIPPGLAEIAVFFGALSYTAPEKVRFAYRIDGFIF
jgi:ligand-binding sensor domain-containing protein